MKKTAFFLLCLIVCVIILPLGFDRLCASALYKDTTTPAPKSTTVITSAPLAETKSADFILTSPTLPPEKNESAVTISIYNTKTGETELILLEDYIIGVMLAEMPASFDIQAIKACAVAARSYTLYRMINGNDKKHVTACVCTDYTHCQGYISYADACEKWSKSFVDGIYDKISAAVYDTAGIVITSQGKVCDAVYHASSRGYTESAKNLWGYDIPYLKSVPTPENDDNTENFSREYVFSAGNFSKILAESGYKGILGSDESKWIGDAAYFANGRVKSVKIGGVALSGVSIRSAFGLASNYFNIKYDGSNIIFTCSGYGHGVGLSQCGANILALNGWGYADILSHYYTGISFGYVTDFTA